MSLKDNLRKLRESAGYTSAKEFSKLVNVPYTTYMGYENRGSWPTEDNLCKMASLLGVTTDELLGYAPKDTDWITAKLKPALDGTSFFIEGINENGDISLAYMDDEVETEHCTFSNDELRAIFEKQEELADQAKGSRLKELLENKLYQEILLRTILS